jgi:hypothetical protein
MKTDAKRFAINGVTWAGKLPNIHQKNKTMRGKNRLRRRNQVPIEFGSVAAFIIMNE